MQKSANKIFIYGPPGSGKSAIGKELAENLKSTFVDLDKRIEAENGRSIDEIFASQGEAHFREIENRILKEVIRSDAGVIALGGGALLDGDNRSNVEKNGTILCLNANRDILLKRILSEGDSRPLLAGDTEAKLESLINSRKQHYAGFENQLDTTKKSISELTREAMVLIGHFFVSGMGRGYDVLVGEDFLDHIGLELRKREFQGPVAVITDENVAKYYLEKVIVSLKSDKYNAYPVVIPAGEANKNINSIEMVWNKFLEYKLERGSTVIALGGGVVGDLAGFAASSFKRGIHWIIFPTSLLAMVDACLGGKTGIDLPGGKNMIGTFYAPRMVMVDINTLRTLPEPEIRNGMAEVIKHGLIGDEVLFNSCLEDIEKIRTNWNEIIKRAMAVKIGIIEKDPYENGERAVLNLGHTLGHALETASNFKMKHGEAISIGMVHAAGVSEYLKIGDTGIRDKIQEAMEKNNLPYRLPGNLDRTRLVELMNNDKKKEKGQVKIVLPVRVGEVRWGVEIDDLTLLVSGGGS